MESRLTYKIDQLSDALNNFESSLTIELNGMDGIVVDTIKSGRIQKFEFCVELIWKTLKVYLLEINGIEARSPKSVIKEYYNLGALDLDDYEQLMETIEDRNRISHIYSQEQFEDIYKRAVQAPPVFRKVLTKMMSS